MIDQRTPHAYAASWLLVPILLGLAIIGEGVLDVLDRSTWWSGSLLLCLVNTPLALSILGRWPSPPLPLRLVQMAVYVSVYWGLIFGLLSLSSLQVSDTIMWAQLPWDGKRVVVHLVAPLIAIALWSWAFQARAARDASQGNR